ncbi:MAG TPA: DegT/DnrJ/EryC1/StrS family aminotransferase [Vicinamibacterales bacterium]|nr:DegT/DnrJ/EryC1/StrS family aminotransferase [Vicinamibacterales bacterium]
MNRPLPFVDLRLRDDADDVRAAIERVLTRGWYVLGPEVEAFEAEFAQASGARFAVGVGNGTDAITLLLRAAGIGRGDQVIVPALTAGFTALAVVAAGAAPLVVDVEPETLTLDARACAGAMTSRVKAIVPVHLYGHPADLGRLRSLADAHRLAIIEDCCQAHLATYAGEPVGTGRVGGAFSFYPTKNLGALGDGGAIITNDAAVAEQVRRTRNGGQSPRHHHVEAGVNSRLDELQAAILRARLRRLPDNTRRRRELARLYRHRLTTVTVPIERDAGHVYHLFPIRSPQRDALRAHLRAAGVETLIHYPVALSEQRAFADCVPAPCPVATAAASELLSLPLDPRLSDEDANRIAEAVNGFAGQAPASRV